MAETFLRDLRWPFGMTVHLLRFKRPGHGLPRSSDFRHLVEPELDRRLPVEDVDQDLELALFDVDLADRPVEVRERPRDDPNGVADLELEPECRLHLLLLDHEDLLDLALGQGGGL